VQAAVEKLRAAIELPIEVECDTLEQVEQALAAGADAILLDNMTPDDVRAARRRVGKRALIEVSGGVTLDTVRALAEACPDFVSIGRLTHSAPAIGLDVLGRVPRGARARTR
jgi:nicotinate-nucleotide pyrophosphorylase (carboxylating)